MRIWPLHLVPQYIPAMLILTFALIGFSEHTIADVTNNYITVAAADVKDEGKLGPASKECVNQKVSSADAVSADSNSVILNVANSGNPPVQRCGRRTCPPNMVCCNASCGICTPPSGVCTQQVCEQPGQAR